MTQTRELFVQELARQQEYGLANEFETPAERRAEDKGHIACKRESCSAEAIWTKVFLVGIEKRDKAYHPFAWPRDLIGRRRFVVDSNPCAG